PPTPPGRRAPPGGGPPPPPPPGGGAGGFGTTGGFGGGGLGGGPGGPGGAGFGGGGFGGGGFTGAGGFEGGLDDGLDRGPAGAESSGLVEDEVVVVLDLRTDYAHVAAKPIEDLQVEYLRRIGRATGRTGHVLVIDHTTHLAEHSGLLRRLAGARSVTQLVVLACGQQPGPGQVELPVAGLMVVLYVGDPRGMGWSPGRARDIRMVDDTLDPDGAENLAALVQALRVPRVFMAVHAKAQEFRYRAAAPGMRIVLGRLDEASLAQARTQAIRMLAERDPASAPVAQTPADALAVLTLLTGDATTDRAGVGPGVFIDAQGVLARTRDAAEHHVTTATTLLAALREEPFAPRPTAAGGMRRAGEAVWAEIQGAGGRLGEFAGMLASAFGRIGGAEGIDRDRGDALAQLGIKPARVAAGEPAALLRSLRQLAYASLGQQEPLAGLTNRLREFAAAAAPAGSTLHARRVMDACHPGLTGNLTNPPRFPLSFAATGPLLTALLSGLLAGLWWPMGIGFGPLAVAVTVWLGVTLHIRRPVPFPRNPQDPRDMARGHLAAFIVVALVGGGAGLGLGRLYPVPVALGIVAVLVGLVLSAAPVFWWRRAVDRWKKQLQLPAAAAAVRNLNDLLASVALNEWILADARLRASRTAGALAAAIDTARASLSEALVTLAQAGGVASPTPPRRLGTELDVGFRLRDRAGQVTDVLTDDLGDIVRTVLDRHAAELTGGFVDDLCNGVDRSMAECLARYADHLEHSGLLTAPPFAGDPRKRVELARSVWQGSPIVGQLRAASVNDEGILQLNRSADLGRLDLAPDGSALVRFVPEVAGVGGDVTTTRSADVAGLIRLVQFRPNAVDAGGTGPRPRRPEAGSAGAGQPDAAPAADGADTPAAAPTVADTLPPRPSPPSPPPAPPAPAPPAAAPARTVPSAAGWGGQAAPAGAAQPAAPSWHQPGGPVPAATRTAQQPTRGPAQASPSTSGWDEPAPAPAAEAPTWGEPVPAPEAPAEETRAEETRADPPHARPPAAEPTDNPW
ncbi:hypothetical protein I6A94_30560, partial [Frankia sp. CN4]|nr:hypothetical protein [Frankia nepalensis]